MASSMAEIEELCASYADVRNRLETLIEALREARRKTVAPRMGELKRLVAQVSGEREALEAAVAESPQLFAQPKSRAFEGVKVGWRKRKGRVVVQDEGAVIARMRKLLPPEQADLLVRVRESVDKAALADLSGTDLKRLGVSIEEDTESPFVATAKTDLDSLVDALLSDGEEGNRRVR